MGIDDLREVCNVCSTMVQGLTPTLRSPLPPPSLVFLSPHLQRYLRLTDTTLPLEVPRHTLGVLRSSATHSTAGRLDRWPPPAVADCTKPCHAENNRVWGSKTGTFPAPPFLVYQVSYYCCHIYLLLYCCLCMSYQTQTAARRLLAATLLRRSSRRIFQSMSDTSDTRYDI